MRILLVDDDTAVIQSLVALLRAQPGHEVRVAINGEKALENAAALGGLDLLITDVVMQPMDGFTLRDEMVRRFPQVRTIFITGYDLNDYPEQTRAHQLLTKPIEPAALLAAIEREGAAVRPETAMPPATAASRTPGVPNVVPRGPVPRAVATMPRAPCGRASAAGSRNETRRGSRCSRAVHDSPAVGKRRARAGDGARRSACERGSRCAAGERHACREFSGRCRGVTDR